MEAVGDNPRSSSEAVAHKTRRGFSLIEAAFVLAVVGAVIGTIWVSAANMYENHKVNKTVEDLQLIVRNVQGLISFRDAEAIDGGAQDVLITSTVRDAGVFPKDWVNGSSIKNPFWGGVNIRSYNSLMFMVDIRPLSRAVCSKLLVKISSLGMVGGFGGLYALGLNLVQVNYPAWQTTTFPISPQTAETACTSATNNLIYFYFPYTRRNN